MESDTRDGLLSHADYRRKYHRLDCNHKKLLQNLRPSIRGECEQRVQRHQYRVTEISRPKHLARRTDSLRQSMRRLRDSDYSQVIYDWILGWNSRFPTRGHKFGQWHHLRRARSQFHLHSRHNLHRASDQWMKPTTQDRSPSPKSLES